MSSKKTDLKKLADLINGIDTAMVTTTAKNGRLVSRPLRTQLVQANGILWFVTDRSSHKVEEIKAHPQVNIAYASAGDNTYVSVSGKGSVVIDKARMHALWSPAMAVFYPAGADDPELCLLKVQMESAEYWDGPGGLIGNALYLAMTVITGDAGVLSDNERMEFGKK